MLTNLKLFWKLALIAVLTPVMVAIVAGIALQGTATLKSEYDNLYSFMLIPIMRLDEGNLHLAQLDARIHDLARPDVPAGDKLALAAAIKAEDQAMMAVIAQYEKQWVTTLSPDFTATLKSLGQQPLQTDEANDMKQFHIAYDAYASQRDQLTAGVAINLRDLDQNVAQMTAAFTALVNVNRQFADLSNQGAQAAVARNEWSVLVAGVVGSLLASYFIQKPLNQARQELRERRQAEAAVQRANAYNRSLLEASPVMLVVTTPDGQIRDLNLATEQISGYSRNELLGTNIGDRVLDQEAARQGLQQAMAGGTLRDLEVSLRHRDGAVISLLCNAAVYRDETGQVMGAVVAARDITERKRAEIELAKSEEKFAKAFRSSPVAMSINDLGATSRLMDVNAAFEQVTGHRRDDILGLNPIQLGLYADPQVRDEILQRLRAEGRVQDFEHRFTRKKW